MDIDLSIERTVGTVITTEYSIHAGILAVIVHLCLIDVTRIHGVSTESASEDAVQLDG